jgi:hypothetical protein
MIMALGIIKANNVNSVSLIVLRFNLSYYQNLYFYSYQRLPASLLFLRLNEARLPIDSNYLQENFALLI